MNKNKESLSTPDPILDAFQDAKNDEAVEEQLGLFENAGSQDIEEANTQLANSNQEKVYKGYDGTEYSEEEWLSAPISNGPTRKEIEGWKHKYGFIYFVPFDGDVFIFRALKRPEYREIVSNTTLSALDREEVFTEKCVIYPYDFSLEKIEKSRAGIASLLAEMIMEKSGFVAQTAPIKL
ncbi:hypothetical protein [Bacillus atrophaeus]|uniref:hypothetical protein n=1 Tax=Bacillus atrophaeus TaxID=1452 RepID=UPI001C0F7090|nr:hypothetical protein [Bacillus atrophaeus]MBU5262125.1 hypothetical protein [Bacillus atrophaeus]MCY8466557.1 hypothetical protein [Bacillus atrophaeus]MCY8479017.1 hypothetical protein [Bacillus atrophaeus]